MNSSDTRTTAVITAEMTNIAPRDLNDSLYLFRAILNDCAIAIYKTPFQQTGRSYFFLANSWSTNLRDASVMPAPAAAENVSAPMYLQNSLKWFIGRVNPSTHSKWYRSIETDGCYFFSLKRYLSTNLREANVEQAVATPMNDMAPMNLQNSLRWGIRIGRDMRFV
jgi:hypothetical protein